MGRGLSELQKGIIKMAYKNVGQKFDEERLKELRTYHGIQKSYEYLTEEGPKYNHFGEIDPHYLHLSVPHLTTREALQGCTHMGARVSISRAFKRLEERKLVERCYSNYYWTGINLTSKGKDVAKSLTVNT